MWSGGPDAIGSVRPAGKWAQGLTCQTAVHTPPAMYNLLCNVFSFLFKVLTSLEVMFLNLSIAQSISQLFFQL